jgi:hypothetical protein
MMTTGQIFRVVWYNFRRDTLARCQVMADGVRRTVVTVSSTKNGHVANLPEKDSKLSGISTTRQHFPTILTSPLAIILIHLKKMIHNPSIITYHHLHPWLHGNLVHIDFDFNFEHFNNDFQIRMDKTLDRSMNGDLKE